MSTKLTPRRIIATACLVATVATAGSLTYSLGLGLVPCHLCWYQRILMYPLVPILAYAYFTHDTGVYRLVIPLSVVGGIIAADQSYLQLASGATCTFSGCGVVQYRVLGLTIPNQSLLGFVLISSLMGILAYRVRAV